jgi:hypothetical protein
VALALSVGSRGDAGAQTETLTVPSVGRVTVYAPTRAPDLVVLIISGDGGWNLGVVSMAERLPRRPPLRDCAVLDCPAFAYR